MGNLLPTRFNQILSEQKYFRLPETIFMQALRLAWWARMPTLRRFCVFSGCLKKGK
ncbi:MAG: hypothetical protein J5680_01160 [Neisseriaceae bacterium]|nr:hypothetical protein [Neisseriaceae bacterium]